jgi:hypothetical protein
VRAGNDPRTGAKTMKTFEAVATLVVAIATQALAVGVIFTS